MAEVDRQQEKLRELQTKVAKKSDTLAEEWTKAVESAKLLEEAARERMELTRQHYDKVE